MRWISIIQTGAEARARADEAEDEALQTTFRLAGGGAIHVERTRALTAIDVDLGERSGASGKTAVRAANLAALGVAARVLRLKGLGGLVVVDLVGRRHDAAAMMSQARGAFGPDNPGVIIAPISRFGTLEIAVPRRSTPAIEILTGGGEQPTPATLALRLVRRLEREARADPGGRFEAAAPAPVYEAAIVAVSMANAVLGGRLSIRRESGP